MKQANNVLAGICGLYCGTCPNYLAKREGDSSQVEAIAKANKMEVADVGCDGCLSSRLMPSCVTCKNGFRACAREKNVTWCFECNEFPCERLRDFSKIHVVDGIPHHASVIEDLEYMKKHGVGDWLMQQEQKCKCPNCGKRLYWSVRMCPACGTEITLDLQINKGH